MEHKYEMIGPKPIKTMLQGSVVAPVRSYVADREGCRVAFEREICRYFFVRHGHILGDAALPRLARQSGLWQALEQRGRFADAIATLKIARAIEDSSRGLNSGEA